MSPRRILFVSHCSVVERYRRRFHLLARQMPDSEITVLVPETWWEGGVYCSPAEQSDGNLRILVRPVTMQHARKQHGHFYPALHRVLRETSPDLVYLDEEPYSAVSAQTALLLTGLCPQVPLVFCTYENLTFSQMNLSRARRLIYESFRRVVFGRAHAAQAVTHGAARALEAERFTKPVFVLPAIGYPPPRVLAPVRQDSEELRIGYLGRLEANKSVETLIAAAEKLRGASVTIGGDGPERFSLERKAGPSIRFCGRVAHDDVGGFLARLHVLVLPSRSMPGWQEQYGRVLVEAMAHGVVPVGSDSGAIPEVIGDAGWVFPEGDAHKLAGILRELGQRHDWEELRNRAIGRAAGFFSDERIATGYAEVIGQLLDRSRPAEALGGLVGVGA
jgi:glycosyltransferase involved in cell wall biosynthesis